MKVYPLTVKQEDGSKVNLTLRLDLAHLRQLKDETGSDPMELISDATSGDAVTLARILDAALNYRNNDNAITDGDELYDLLVDNDVCGLSGWAELLGKVVTVSGILTAKQMQGIRKKLKKAEAMMEDEDEPEGADDAENPTATRTETAEA